MATDCTDAADRSNDKTELNMAQNEIRAIDAKIEKISNLLAETTATDTLLRKIESLEQERADIQQKIKAAEAASQQAQAMQGKEKMMRKRY